MTTKLSPFDPLAQKGDEITDFFENLAIRLVGILKHPPKSGGIKFILKGV